MDGPEGSSATPRRAFEHDSSLAICRQNVGDERLRNEHEAQTMANIVVVVVILAQVKLNEDEERV